ncbi:hypothetical protein CDD83_4281 [Cordyceps sp. RAO-2017]|nr:hypothetical protein CDD83_4281 [Cordyceps sp. RAO-2017]
MGLRQLSLLSLLPYKVLSGATSYGEDSGLIGYGIQLFQPVCAFACLFSIAPPLNCSREDMTAPAPKDKYTVRVKNGQLPSGEGWHVTPDATPQCKQHDDFYLQTVAFCIQAHCEDVPLMRLEKFWDSNVPWQMFNDKKYQPVPRQTYSQALGAIRDPPRRPVNNTVLLNYTAMVPEETYLRQHDTIYHFVSNELTHERYALVLFLSGVIIPIALSLLRLLPWPTLWVTRFNAYVIQPPLVGTKHSTPLRGLGVMPTRGQAIFLLYLWLINIFLSLVGYDLSCRGSLWSTNQTDEMKKYVSNRHGVLSFAHLPLLALYAGRNNVLLWLTNWSRTTFLLLHRWAAFICIIHAIVHSLIYLQMAIAREGGLDFAKVSLNQCWTWGTVGTVAMSAILLASLQPLRQRMYEVFLISHIALAILTIIGCYYHITPRYGQAWGFQTWLYISIAIWAFDRMVRVMRSVRGGLKRAYLTPIDDEYFRLDIPDISASGHVYLCFPTIKLWRMWESHPFSVAGVTYSKGPSHEPKCTLKDMDGGVDHLRQTAAAGLNDTSESMVQAKDVGLVFFIRKQDGMTALLSKRGSGKNGLPVIVEGSYNPDITLLHGNHLAPTHQFPNLICIAGGVGITGVLPALDAFSSPTHPLCRRKLYWGVRTMPLVHAVEEMLGHSCEDAADRRWGDIDVKISVGARLGLRSLLKADLRSQNGGTVVVVCGSSSMADSVRCIVSGLARHQGENGPVLVKLVVESFAW